MNRELNKAKNLFALAFALCVGGVIVQSNPEYLVKFFNIIHLNGILPQEANAANKFIQIYAVIQSLLGGCLLSISGLWIHKIGKNNNEVINHE